MANAFELNSKFALSENYNPEYERAAFMQVVPSKKYGGAPWIDPLDPRLLKILKGKIPYEEIYYSNKPITNIAQEKYSTTTNWWLILMFNGYLHAQDIPDGTKIKIPSFHFIEQKLNTNTQNNRGKIVTV